MNKHKGEHRTTYTIACKTIWSKGVSHLLKTLEQSCLELPNATADGVLIQPVRLLEGIEPT